MAKNEMRIRNVASDIKEGLQNIAKNKGITLNDFMRFQLRDILDKHSEREKQGRID
ncbi:MAG: hypothetical protein H7282_05045 [Cytophagaceae bacterium]|nr:hypothetical protein [Cytophagaceae bacterium]